MNGIDVTRIVIALIAVVAIVTFSINKLLSKKISFDAHFIAKTGIFAAISVILYVVPFFKFAVPFFPAFLEIHLDEIPAFIAGFAYGPISAIFVIIIKTIIKLPFSNTMCVGELADLLYSIAFVIPAAIIYKKKNNFKGAAVGFGVGFVIQITFATIFTSFVMLNFYMYVMGLSEEAILNMCKAINPAVTSLGWTFALLVALPFNAFKNVIVILITLLLYKKLHKLIDKISIKKLGS